MKSLISLLLFLSFIAGCTRHQSPADIAREHIQGWGSMGMYLPKDQVSFFADNFPNVSVLLSDALRHPNEDVRQRAAYVIEELGPVAASLEEDLADSVRSEASRLVRLYQYNALLSIGANNSSTIKLLRDNFAALPERIAVATGDETYTTTDERIYLASALYVLDSAPQAKKSYFKEVAQWLAPPPSNLSQSELDVYWEHRWCAVNVVANMRGASEAIPLLQAMLEEESRKPWVSVHVPRAIKSLKKEGNSQQNASADADKPRR